MGRGRKRALTENRLLLEILLHDRAQAPTGDILDHVDVSDQTVRNRAQALADEGKIEIITAAGSNFYRLKEPGYAQLASELRDATS